MKRLTRRQALIELRDLDAVLTGQKRYATFTDGSVIRSRHLPPLIHNGGKPR